MRLIPRFFITVLLLLGTAQIFAEEKKTLELKSIDKKIAKIETKINALKSKGFKSLSKEERIEYSNLKKQLLTTMREKKEKMLKDQNIQLEELKAILE